MDYLEQLVKISETEELVDREKKLDQLRWDWMEPLTDTDVKYLLLYFEQNYGLTSEKKMTAALSIVAHENC